MSKPAKIAALVCLILAAFLAGRWASRKDNVPAAASAASEARHVLYWTCPMHPQYKSDHAGDAPCCGMRLVPVYSGSQPEAAEDSMPSGAVQIGAAGQQLIGVRTGQVERAPFTHRMRLPGRVAVDSDRLYPMVAAVDGWTRELGSNPPGTLVRRNEILASYYTRDFVAAQQTLLYAANTSDQFEKGSVSVGITRTAASLNLQSALDGLRTLGVSEFQLDEMRRTRAQATQIYLYAPADGVVLARNISPAQRFEKGFEFYRIADISHVWVVTDLFEKDRELAKYGAMARVRYQDRTYQARLSDSLPQFDAESRTLKLRFGLENPGLYLRPDMFVDVELQVEMPASITAPDDAVLDTGTKRTVYVDRGNGYYEPREVATGWRLGGRTQILKGLEPGERIVVAGNFLLDSESRLKASQHQ